MTGKKIQDYTDFSREELLTRIATLEQQVECLRQQPVIRSETGETVSVPAPFSAIFQQAQDNVQRYFHNLAFKPSQGLIEVENERYVLVRASSLSCDFFNYLRHLYSDRDAQTAFQTGQDFLFDIGHVLGIADAKCFHAKMNLQEPIEKLSAGPVHFAYAGWGFVEILPESNPSPDENFYLKYHHPYSFEADSWLSRDQRSQDAVCIMNAAYSSGWCEASFGMPLTAVEVACRARGDETCTFIMAPPHRITDYLATNTYHSSAETPLFFNRKVSEEIIRASLQEKEILLQEIHHRVKNNLQVIVSLMALQLKQLKNPEAVETIRQTQYRISSIAMVHEMLYDSDSLSHISYKEYVQRLLEQMIQTLTSPAQKIDLQLKIDEIFIQIDTAIPLGLILNELTANALKHAFVGRLEGCIQVQLEKQVNGNYCLIFADDGPGLPPHMNLQKSPSLGLRLIQNLVRQLQGTLEHVPPKQGCCFKISFQEVQST
ncbi:MAG: histidine kinase dimerization/phosphoacceptor domain -containing protein [Candidatus Sericytochromatia bacterium]